MSLSPGSRLGPYEVVSLIGVGGMGEVYRARQASLDRDVALDAGGLRQSVDRALNLRRALQRDLLANEFGESRLEVCAIE